MADQHCVLDVCVTPFGPMLLRDGRPVPDLRAPRSVLWMLDVTTDIIVEQLELEADQAEQLALEVILGRPAAA